MGKSRIFSIGYDTARRGQYMRLFPIFLMVSAFHIGVPALAQDSQWNELTQRTLRQEKATADSKNEFTDKSLAVLVEQARYLRTSGRAVEAESRYIQTMSQIRARIPGADKFAFETKVGLASIFVDQCKYRDAEVLLKDALLSEGTTGPDDENILASALEGLAEIYNHQSKHHDAMELCNRALSIRKRSNLPGASATTLRLLADAFNGTGWKSEAENTYRSAIREANTPPQKVLILCELASFYQASFKHGEGEATSKFAHSLVMSNMGSPSPTMGKALHSLAARLTYSNPQEAERLFTEALRIEEETVGPSSIPVARTLQSLGDLIRRKSPEKAAVYFERALLINRQPGCPTRDLIKNLGALAGVCRDLYRQETLYKEKLELLQKESLKPGGDKKTYPSDADELAKTMRQLGHVYSALSKLDLAESVYARLLDMEEKSTKPNYLAIVAYLDDLTFVSNRRQDYKQCERLQKKSLAISEKAFGRNDQSVIGSLNKLADNYWHMGRIREAEELHKRALSVAEKSHGHDSPAASFQLALYADFRHKVGLCKELQKTDDTKYDDLPTPAASESFGMKGNSSRSERQPISAGGLLSEPESNVMLPPFGLQTPSPKPGKVAPSFKRKTNVISTEKVTSNNLTAYIDDATQLLNASWYPPNVNFSFQVVLRCKIHSDGRVSDVVIEKGSGDKSNDDSAVALMLQPSRLAPLPQKLTDITVRFVLVCTPQMRQNIISQRRSVVGQPQSPQLPAGK